jgi:hypothetical protein
MSVKERHQVDRIVRPGFTCQLCGTNHTKMVDMRKHGAQLHRSAMLNVSVSDLYG